jgi:hypothetical protein
MPIEINSKSNPLRTPWNKGSRRTEASLTAERGLSHSRPTSDQAQQTRSGDVQPRHRQQASGLRSRQPSGRDIAVGGHVRNRATIIQRKTGRPVQFEITEQTRASLQDWLNARPADRGPYVFPSRVQERRLAGTFASELDLLRQSQGIIDLDPESTVRYLEGRHSKVKSIDPRMAPDPTVRCFLTCCLGSAAALQT